MFTIISCLLCERLACLALLTEQPAFLTKDYRNLLYHAVAPFSIYKPEEAPIHYNLVGHHLADDLDTDLRAIPTRNALMISLESRPALKNFEDLASNSLYRYLP